MTHLSASASSKQSEEGKQPKATKSQVLFWQSNSTSQNAVSSEPLEGDPTFSLLCLDYLVVGKGWAIPNEVTQTSPHPLLHLLVSGCDLPAPAAGHICRHDGFHPRGGPPSPNATASQLPLFRHLLQCDLAAQWCATTDRHWRFHIHKQNYSWDAHEIE